MKNFITLNGAMVAVDKDSMKLEKCARSVSMNVDYAYLMPEDGTLVGGSKTFDVKEGDLAILLYGKYNIEQGMREDGEYIVIPKDHPFTISVRNNYEEEISRRNSMDSNMCVKSDM